MKALTGITTRLSELLNKKRLCVRKIVFALNLSKAFDTVGHDTLFQSTLQSILSNSRRDGLLNYYLSKFPAPLQGIEAPGRTYTALRDIFTIFKLQL